MNSFETVFVVPEKLDLSSGDYSLAVMGVVLGLLALMRLVFLLFHKNPGRSAKEKQSSVLTTCYVLAAGLVFVLMDCAGGDNDWWANWKYSSKDYHIVEGYVQVTQPLNETPYVNTADHIKISFEPFLINSYRKTQCYNVTVNKGGVLRNGVYAKVYYADTGTIRNNILRIDLPVKDALGSDQANKLQ